MTSATPPVVVGAAMTCFGRTEAGLRGLAEQATAEALADAELSARDVHQVYFGNGAAGLLQGQEMIRGQVLLRDTGLLGSMVINVENACASSSTAFYLAVNAVRSGAAGIAMAIGAEQMVLPDKARVFGCLASATDTERRADMLQVVRETALGQARVASASPTASPLMDHYAAKGRDYMARTGATVDDLARVVVKSRAFGAGNPRAHFTRPTTVEEVLATRLISEPLHLAMCAPISNGAAAIVVVSPEIASRRGLAGVGVLGVAVVSNDPSSAISPTRAASGRTYEEAGVGPEEVSFAEVHDAAASAELIIMEELGLCPEGTAFEFLRGGRTRLAGDIPVNTSGGLMSRGHPLGATGCGQLVEVVDQLRGRCGIRQVASPRFGLAQNGGGVLDGDEATVTVSILERLA
jgi:acetyl-CoA acetyltransferase